MQSYQKINGMHKPEVEGILEGNITVEEKLDGSQFRIHIDTNGEVHCGSHHQELSNIDSNFKIPVDEAIKIFSSFKPTHDVVIFTEYIGKNKQNAIAYERIPKHLFVVFDVTINGEYLDREHKEAFCALQGLEVTPLLYGGLGIGLTENTIKELLTTPSFLGHQAGFDRIEGIVIKNYDKKYTFDEGHSLYGHFMCGKIVNDEFKEKTKTGKPRGGNELDALKASVATKARWRKAIQHLKESGDLKGLDSDIPLLIREIMTDLKAEEESTIKEELYKLFGKEVIKSSVNGFVSWYQKEGHKLTVT